MSSPKELPPPYTSVLMPSSNTDNYSFDTTSLSSNRAPLMQGQDTESPQAASRSSWTLFRDLFPTIEEILSKQWVRLTCCTALAAYHLIGLLFTRLNRKPLNADYFLIGSIACACPLVVHASRRVSKLAVWISLIVVFVLQVIASHYITRTWGTVATGLTMQTYTALAR